MFMLSLQKRLEINQSNKKNQIKNKTKAEFKKKKTQKQKTQSNMCKSVCVCPMY